MSRRDELLKLAKLYHSQARLIGSRPVKQGLRRLGDRYRNEAEKLQRQASADSHTEKSSGKHGHAHAA